MFVVTDLVGRADLADSRQAVSPVAKAYDGVEGPVARADARLLPTRTCAPATFPACGRRAAIRTAPSPRCCRRFRRPTSGRLMAVLDTQVGNGIDEDSANGATWSMLEDMHRAGFTIGSHTRTHVWLGHESEARRRRRARRIEAGTRTPARRAGASFRVSGRSVHAAGRGARRPRRLSIRLHRLRASGCGASRR